MTSNPPISKAENSIPSYERVRRIVTIYTDIYWSITCENKLTRLLSIDLSSSCSRSNDMEVHVKPFNLNIARSVLRLWWCRFQNKISIAIKFGINQYFYLSKEEDPRNSWKWAIWVLKRNTRTPGIIWNYELEVKLLATYWTLLGVICSNYLRRWKLHFDFRGDY